MSGRTLMRESSFRILDEEQTLRGRARTLKRMTQSRRTTLINTVDWTRPSTWTLRAVRAKCLVEPNWARTQDEDGRLPLHSVAGAVRSPEIVRYVIGAFPEAAAHRDKHGFFPLHFAAYENRSTDVLTYLLNLFVAMAGNITNDGSCVALLCARGLHAVFVPYRILLT